MDKFRMTRLNNKIYFLKFRAPELLTKKEAKL